MTQAVGNVSDEGLWGVICDELHDEHPPERVRWLREHREPTTLGMVWRAAPRLRGLIEGQWPRWNVSPKELRVPQPAQMVRMVMLEGPDTREGAWSRLPAGFTAWHGDRRQMQHPALGRVVLAVRGAQGTDQWPQWHALYQERWGIEAADYELAWLSHLNGVRFGEGGLQGLLEDLRVEVQRQEEAHAEAQRVMEVLAQRTAQRVNEAWPGGVVQEERIPMRGAMTSTVRPQQQGWTHRGVDMGIALDALLGSPVEFVRNAATMSTTVRWVREGVQVEVGDQETVMSPGPEALARNIVQRLLEARRAMPNPPSW